MFLRKIKERKEKSKLIKDLKCSLMSNSATISRKCSTSTAKSLHFSMLLPLNRTKKWARPSSSEKRGSKKRYPKCRRMLQTSKSDWPRLTKTSKRKSEDWSRKHSTPVVQNWKRPRRRLEARGKRR